MVAGWSCGCLGLYNTLTLILRLRGRAERARESFESTRGQQQVACLAMFKMPVAGLGAAASLWGVGVRTDGATVHGR